VTTPTSTRPPQPHTDTAVPGISLAEASIMTRAAQRLLHRAGTDANGATTTAITAQLATLREPHTPAKIGDYDCTMPDNTHRCTAR
jgi:hypothetical protein